MFEESNLRTGDPADSLKRYFPDPSNISLDPLDPNDPTNPFDLEFTNSPDNPSPPSWEATPFWDPEQHIGVLYDPLHMEQRSSSGYVEGDFDFAELHKRLKSIKKTDRREESLQKQNDSGSDHSMGGPPRKHRKIGESQLKALDWTGLVVLSTEKFIGGGGFGDVFEGEWIDLPSSEKSQPPRIVVKRFKVSSAADIEQTIKLVFREIAVWHKLSRTNIVPFIGVTHSPGEFPRLVSEWMSNGGVKDYINRTPSACLRAIILGIARGLKCLHEASPVIIHGDLKGDNVLVNRLGEPCLCDFGLSRVLENNTMWNTSATHASGTMRWMSPELLKGEQPTVTTESDIYAYGMTCYEVMKGDIPLHNYKVDVNVLLAILRNERPQRDADCITDDLWELMQFCWSSNPMDRPNTEQIFEQLTTHDCEKNQSECIFRQPASNDVAVAGNSESAP